MAPLPPSGQLEIPLAESAYEVPGMTLTAEDRVFARELSERARHVIKSGRFKPPLLPEVAVRLSAFANYPDATVADVESAVSRDPAVAARIVSMANSAMYSRGVQVNSLRVAISRLGVVQVRDIVCQMTKSTLFRTPGYADYLRDSFEVAVACGMLCREVSKVVGTDRDTSYLCGLLHDIGVAAIVKVVADTARSQDQPLPTLTRLRPALHLYHASLGAWLCKQWRLSDIIVEAVLGHHQTTGPTASPSRMAGVVATAERLLAHAGLGGPRVPLTGDEPILQQLGLTTERSWPLAVYAESLVQNHDG